MSDSPSPAGVLRAHDLHARKRLGQNFLRDRSFVPRILAAGEIGPGDQVLEIGAGTGILTDALAAAAQSVLAIELDDALDAMLRERYRDRSTVRIWHGNALAFDACEHLTGRYKLVANIPYYITGPIVRHFLEAACQPTILVLMVQREVATRMAAPAGMLSLLGVSVQYYAAAKIMVKVPAGAFYPVPRVDSAIVRLIPHRQATGEAVERAFFDLARAGFGTRRKQLANALMHGLQIERAAAVTLLDVAGLDGSRRAETLTIAEWERLAGIYAGRLAAGA